MSAVPSPGRPAAGEQLRDLADVPSFPAVYAAALDPRAARVARRGEPVLPALAYRVRGVRIDAERARDFDHLMGGPATDLVHPGVLHVLAFPVSLAVMARRDFPFPLLGLVHLRNQVLQHRPVRVGELVDVECRVRDLRPHHRGRTFEAVSTILSEDGEIIATDVSTYLAKDASRAEASGTSPAGEGAGARAERREFAPPQPTGRWSLPADTGRRYAAVSGDVNPIHLSALTAKAFGFPAAIAHGMYTASRAFTESRVDLSRPLRWDVTFDAPVTLPGTVLVAYDDQPDARSVRCVGWKPARGEKPARRSFSVEVATLG
ncbi:MaoC/PaaZ C-terminal domain-containing protein [Brachybacterium sp. UNK5269]|uniref:MaoC/PaaZ C-terminal domain-containing protein n=1 Tax=Brachybacterium sp. UNK5269 TaxID=3408576 RepID=UPI003BAF63D7